MSAVGKGKSASLLASVQAQGATVVERRAGGWTELVRDADLVVPSPGVRPEHPSYIAARAAGVPVRGDVDLGMEAARVPVGRR